MIPDILAFAAAAGSVVQSPAPVAPPAQAGQQRPDIVVSDSDRALALGNLTKTIREQHFSAAEGARIASVVERRMKEGRYAKITSGRALAAALTTDLREISRDQHFLVDYFAMARPFPVPQVDGDVAVQQREMALTNFGVTRAERLDGNIGYLRIDRFGPVDGAGPVIQGAMAMLALTDALIIDLRYNGGGHADTGALLAGQLLPESTRMSDIVDRDGVKQRWTPTTLTARYVDKPVYVLVSPRTFSAAEGFAYDLRTLGRVKIVGATTRGGANPVSRTLLSSRFWMLVPVAQARNPVTGTNWDGTGVKPDVEIAPDLALTEATRAAARQLLSVHRDDPLTRELQTLVATP